MPCEISKVICHKERTINMSEKGIETSCVQGGYTPGNGEPRQIPIIQSTTFKYSTGDEMAKLFDLEASGYFYSRLQNPTCDTVAAKIAELEGGTAAMLTSSGQAANFFAVFNIASCGDHVVAESTIYGGTYNLFSVTMKKMGIDLPLSPQTAPTRSLRRRLSPIPRRSSARPSPTLRFACSTLNALQTPHTDTVFPSSLTTPSQLR